MPSSTSPPPPFDLVMLGGDVGIYGLARAFHEEFAVRSTVISRQPTGPVTDSVVIDNVFLGADATADDHVDELLRRGRSRTSTTPVLLLANTDGWSQTFAARRAELDAFYVLSLVDTATLDQIADKGRFEEVCREVGVPTPRTVIQDFSGADDPGWAPEPLPADLSFPVVAKAAASTAYERIDYPGKRKVDFVQTREELEDLWRRLRAAGFRDRFVVQELIPGDDTWMRSLTAYRDQFGVVTMMCTAQVLLEEHTPLALGNPCAMVTTPFPELMDHARRLLDHLGYQGFANFDVKVDPRDGSARFLEVNPRIGRNNYYVTASGVNVARYVVADVIENRRVEPVTSEREVVYSLVPRRLLLRYVTDPGLRSHVKRIARRAYVNPLLYRIEGWRRRRYAALASANHVVKFLRYYPRPTESGF
jgi:D-aspartate ligase